MDSSSFRLAVQLRDQLLVELRQNQTFLAYQHIEAAILALSTKAGSALHQEPTVSDKDVRRSFRSGSQSEAILTGTVAYLQEKRGRAQSGEILKALSDRGIEVGGKKPSATLSSYLSHSALFDNIRGQGYGLAESSKLQSETPNSGTLFGAPKANGAEPLSP